MGKGEEMTNDELTQNNIDIYAILQMIKSNPDMVDYYIRVYAAKLAASNIPLDTLQL